MSKDGSSCSFLRLCFFLLTDFCMNWEQFAGFSCSLVLGICLIVHTLSLTSYLMKPTSALVTLCRLSHLSFKFWSQKTTCKPASVNRKIHPTPMQHGSLILGFTQNSLNQPQSHTHHLELHCSPIFDAALH